MNLENEYKAIYELNNNSSLFVRIADDEMKKGNFENALSLLNSKVELFENYATPYLLLAKCNKAIGNIDEAEKNFKIGNSLLNASFQSNTYFLESKVDTDKSFEDEHLEELADKLKVAKIEVDSSNTIQDHNTNVKEESGNFKPLKGLVSETLASIYFEQSNYKEAKAIYETLIDIQPERTEYFNQKISEIEAKMRT